MLWIYIFLYSAPPTLRHLTKFIASYCESFLVNKCQCMWFSSKFLQSSKQLKCIQMSENKGSHEKRKKRDHPGCGETPVESAPETAETSRFFRGVPLNQGQNPPPQLILFTALSPRIRYLSSLRTWFIKVFSLPLAGIISTAHQSWRPMQTVQKGAFTPGEALGKCVCRWDSFRLVLKSQKIFFWHFVDELLEKYVSKIPIYNPLQVLLEASFEFQEVWHSRKSSR